MGAVVIQELAANSGSSWMSRAANSGSSWMSQALQPILAMQLLIIIKVHEVWTNAETSAEERTTGRSSLNLSAIQKVVF